MSDMNYFTADRNLRRLIQKSLDEPITADEVHELESALASDRKLRLAYLEAVQLHVDLSDHNQAVQLCRRTIEEFPKEAASISFAKAAKERVRKFRLHTALPYAAAILISGMCLGCGIGIVAASVIYKQPDFRPARWQRSVGPTVKARIVGTHQARWQHSESPETLPTRSLTAGQEIRLESGLVQLTLRNDVQLLLEGPVTFEIRADDSCKLYAGKLTAIAGPTAGSLAIETAAGVIQMRDGTVGVIANEQETACHNYSAFVQAELHSGQIGEPTRVAVGETSNLITVGVGQATLLQAPPAEVAKQFVLAMPLPEQKAFIADTIMLSNLFDDSTDVTLTEAMSTDTYQAACETTDLGIAAVRDGGLDVDFPLVDGGVLFNLYNVGGGGARVRGLPGNDTYRSTHPVAIRTTGKAPDSEEIQSTKIEDGIGICTNEMITFDLDEIRAAGDLGNTDMRFRSDRAGLNDRYYQEGELYANLGTARFVVIVSTPKKVLAAYIDGQRYDVAYNAGVYSLDVQREELPKVVQRDGKFVEFDVPLPAEAKFLTLATTMWEHTSNDHAVFSGARLEILREEPQAQ